jgi:uncharacterized membrane protein
MTNVKWRGGQVTRIEALTDAVFGFAITFLFVSFDVPTDFDALTVQLRGFIPFAGCFALLLLVWFYHYKLFGKFDLDDGYTMMLNSVLLFVVLFYIFPLKFVFTAWLGGGKTFSNFEQIRSMMTLYSAGYCAVFVVFGLMYYHAYRKRAELALNDDDVFFAVQHIGECGVMVFVGALSVVLAQTVPVRQSALAAGFVYMIIGPLQWYRSVWMAKRRTQFMPQISS